MATVDVPARTLPYPPMPRWAALSEYGLAKTSRGEPVPVLAGTCAG